MTILRCFNGDSKTLEIPMTWDGAAFTPGTDWSLIFTAKESNLQLDDEAKIQKSSGTGITVTASTASVALVPDDTLDLDVNQLFWDIQAQHNTTGSVRTVASGKLGITRDTTRETTTSVTIYTTEPPAPLVEAYTLPTASASVKGGIIVGSGLTITAGVLSTSGSSYTLPIAGASTLGGIKSSTDILVDVDGVATVNGSATGEATDAGKF